MKWMWDLAGVMGYPAAQERDWWENTQSAGRKTPERCELGGRRSPGLLPAEQFRSVCLLIHFGTVSFNHLSLVEKITW